MYVRCMYVCITLTLHTYIHTCMHACMHTYIHTYIYKLSQTSNATRLSVYKIISYEIISILMLLLHITMTICPSGISGYCLKSCSTEHHRRGYKSLLFF